MRDQTGQRFVTDDDRRRDETQARIFHAAERKAGRQDQHVVTAPLVRAIEFLRHLDHFLGIDELGGGGIGHAGFGPDPGTRRNRFEYDIADRDGQQIGRNFLRHAEAVIAVPHRFRIVVGAHQRHQGSIGADAGIVGEAHARRILQGHPGAGVDGLRLAEHERLSAGGHFRRQPLQTGSLRHGAVGDAHARQGGRKLDAQGRAQHRIRGIETVGQRLPGFAIETLHGPDVQGTGIQHQFTGLVVLPFQKQFGAAGKRACFHVGAQIQRQMVDADAFRLCVGIRIGDIAAVHDIAGRPDGFGGGLARGQGQRHQRGNQQTEHGHFPQILKPLWMATMPPERLRTAHCSKPACSSMAFRPAWLGCLRIDSAR